MEMDENNNIEQSNIESIKGEGMSDWLQKIDNMKSLYMLGGIVGIGIIIAIIVKVTTKEKKKDYYNLESDILTNKYL